MAVNWIIYLVSLFAAICFYIAASPVWFSWVVLFILLILPLLSLLLSLPQMLRVQLRLSAPERVEQGRRLVLELIPRSHAFLPLPELRLRLCLQTQGDEHVEYRYLRHIPREGGTVWLEAEQPGLFLAGVSQLRVYDYLGLFGLPRPAPAQTRTAVLPQPVQPDPLPDLTAFRVVRLAALPQGSFSENHDHRPYREGDNVRSIHWKLSQKTDDLIVREPVAPVRLRSYLIVSPPRDLPALQSELAQLRYLSTWLTDRELPHTVLWMEQQGVHTREIASADEVEPMLAEACAAPLFPAGDRSIPAEDADWCFRIVPEGEVAE